VNFTSLVYEQTSGTFDGVRRGGGALRLPSDGFKSSITNNYVYTVELALAVRSSRSKCRKKASKIRPVQTDTIE